MHNNHVENNITLSMANGTELENPFKMVLTGPKLHGIKITQSLLDYHGSITIDAEILEKSGLYPLEFVNIWNKNSGTRISTYILPGTRGSGTVCLNGAAARSCQVGDEVIITAERPVEGMELLAPQKPYSYQARVLVFNHEKRVNTIAEVMEYRLVANQAGKVDFSLTRIE